MYLKSACVTHEPIWKRNFQILLDSVIIKNCTKLWIHDVNNRSIRSIYYEMSIVSKNRKKE
jgi:hypothetical protein